MVYLCLTIAPISYSQHSNRSITIDSFCVMVFKFLFILCAFLVLGGQEYPVPPSVCPLGRGLFSLSLFMLALGRACDLLWEEGWRGGGLGVVWFVCM